MLQKALTVIVKVKADKAAALSDLLDRIGQDIRAVRENDVLDFSKFSRVHFARVYLIPNAKTGIQDTLVFESNYDTTLKEHLDEMVDQAGDALEQVFGACVGWPQLSVSDARFKRAFRTFIRRHSYDYGAFYIGYRGESVKQVKQYGKIRDWINTVLNLPDMRRLPMGQLQEFLGWLPTRQTQPPAWLQQVRDRLKFTLQFIVFVLDTLARLVNVFVLRPLKNLILRREPALNLALNDDDFNEGITDIEDVVTQNQLTVISPIKPGWQALAQLKFNLLLVNMVAKHFANQGDLSGIATIHFARWVIIDKGRYLLFHSNYDGSWDSYIGDFVDKAAAGMDNIWRSYPKYPEQGAIDIERFKRVIRTNQVRTHAFYSAYPDRTVVNILNDRAIAKALDRRHVTEFLRRL